MDCLVINNYLFLKEEQPQWQDKANWQTTFERMAVGKNKRLSKGKKGKGKKAIDPFKEKEWYELKAPAVFTHRNIGKTIVSRTKGTHVASEAIKGRIVEANLADLNKDEDAFFRKFKLEILDVENRTAKTQFYGMDFTTDKVRSLVKKWQTLIDTHLDVTTTDGYKLRLFCVAFTKKRQNCLRKTYYASTAQIKMIRKKIFEIMAKESACELKDLIKKFVAETIGSAIEKASENIYPLKDVFIRKVKLLKAPKFDISKLNEAHEGSAEDTGRKVSA